MILVSRRILLQNRKESHLKISQHKNSYLTAFMRTYRGCRAVSIYVIFFTVAGWPSSFRSVLMTWKRIRYQCSLISHWLRAGEDGQETREKIGTWPKKWPWINSEVDNPQRKEREVMVAAKMSQACGTCRPYAGAVPELLHFTLTTNLRVNSSYCTHLTDEEIKV